MKLVHHTTVLTLALGITAANEAKHISRRPFIPKEDVHPMNKSGSPGEECEVSDHQFAYAQQKAFPPLDDSRSPQHVDWNNSVAICTSMNLNFSMVSVQACMTGISESDQVEAPRP